jgi:hypothetical protein
MNWGEVGLGVEDDESGQELADQAVLGHQLEQGGLVLKKKKILFCLTVCFILEIMKVNMRKEAGV